MMFASLKFVSIFMVKVRSEALVDGIHWPHVVHKIKVLGRLLRQECRHRGGLRIVQTENSLFDG